MLIFQYHNMLVWRQEMGVEITEAHVCVVANMCSRIKMHLPKLFPGPPQGFKGKTWEI